MDFQDTPQEAAFREEARTWLKQNVPTEAELQGLDMIAQNKLWQKRKYDAGWACLRWPKEYGGRGASAIEQVIFNQEESKFRETLDRGRLLHDRTLLPRPGEQLVQRPRVDNPLQRHAQRVHPGRAVVEEVELPRRVGVAVHREQAPDLDREPQQVVGRVLPLRPAVDLDGSAVLRARREHVVRVEHGLGPLADEAPRAVTEDVDVR